MKPFLRSLALGLLLAIAPAWGAAPKALTQHQKLDLIRVELAAAKADLAKTAADVVAVGASLTNAKADLAAARIDLATVKTDVAAIKACLMPGTTPPTVITAPPVVGTPPPPSSSGINYALYRGMTPQEILSPFGPFHGQGLPAGWNWDAAYAAGVLNPDAAKPPTPPPPAPNFSGQVYDQPAFDWANPGSWRRIVAPGTKTLPVPPGYKGVVRFEISGMAGGTADFVRVTVLDGATVVAMEPLIGVAGGNIRFQAQGGRTYTLLVEGAGAVVSVNLLIGG